MTAISYYHFSAEEGLNFPQVHGAQHGKVVVIGGGFAGLATALGLSERGESDVILLEQHAIGHGASGRNGGFVFGGFSLGERDLIRQQGPERGRALYQLTTDAVTTIRSRVERYAIDCDWNPAGVLLADWFHDRQRLKETLNFMNQVLGAGWEYVSEQALSRKLATRRYGAALLEPNAAHFHPLKYARGLARTLDGLGVRLYEHSPALSIKGEKGNYRVTTPDGEIAAEQVVIAAGGYIHPLPVKAAKAILPIATYVMATEPLGDRTAQSINTASAVYDTRFAFDYYRVLPDTRLLWGGRISIRDPSPATIEHLLRRDLARVFPELGDAPVSHVWSGLMGYPRHKMPMVREVRAGLWLCFGFGGHGVAPTTALGELTAAAIAEHDEQYRLLADYAPLHAGGRAGQLAAQLTYWWLEGKDALRDRFAKKDTPTD